MKTKKHKILFAVITLLLLTALCLGGGVLAAEEKETAYYVCFSNENYALRNANKMIGDGGEYYLYDRSLSSLVDFYVTDNAGRRWYAADGGEMAVEESGTYSYTLRFSPDRVFGEEEGWEATDCHITYGFYQPDSYTLTVGDREISMTYNPYRTAYDEYYISSLYVSAGSVLSVGDAQWTVTEDGWYRFLYTPGEVRGQESYAYNRQGEYGSGSGYDLHLYGEDAPRYFWRMEGETEYRPLERYENNVNALEYRGEPFFVQGRDTVLKYAVYEQNAGGSYRLVDDDGDSATLFSTMEIADVGWYTLSFTDGGDRFTVNAVWDPRTLPGFYLAGEFNRFGFDQEGNVDTLPAYFFREVEENSDDYDGDFRQYILWFTVSEKAVKNEPVAFYITNGKDKYKNGTAYIEIGRAGTYKILFSEEHRFGNGRHYRYVLQEETKEWEDVEIGSVEEFLAFAEACRQSADYSKNKAVYLTCDLDFAGVSFGGVGSFSGCFYGGYHRLKNIALSKDVPAVFETVTRDGRLERLTVENLTQNDREADYVGFVGKNFGTLYGITVSGRLTGNTYVGALAGLNGRSREDESTGSADSDQTYRYGRVEQCQNRAEIGATVHGGGIVGYNQGEILACENSGSVEAVKQSSASRPFNFGGIAGYSSGRVEGCGNTAPIRAGEAFYAGGICGLSDGEFYFVTNSGPVNARRFAGGIVGYFGRVNKDEEENKWFDGMSVQEVYDSFFKDDAADFEESEGAGQILTYSQNRGDVQAVSYAGGIVGYGDRTGLAVSACQSMGNVAVTAGSYAGGIGGYLVNTTVESSFSAGRITAQGLNGGLYVGGIVGYGDNLAGCFSVAELSGSDYIGGLAGYHRGNLYACWSHVLLTPARDAEYVGHIAGFTEGWDEAADRFRSRFEANYYMAGKDDRGGIGGRKYGETYDFAAEGVTEAILSFAGTVSPRLTDHFTADGLWQGRDVVSYPVPTAFFEASACPLYGDETDWNKAFARYGTPFTREAEAYSGKLYTVSFLEWNEDNGSLWDDEGVLQEDRFDCIASFRVPAGTVLMPPAFRYAVRQENMYVFDGKEASYFVSFPSSVTVEENQAVYAVYREIVRTVAAEDESILVEGLFDADTQATLIPYRQGWRICLTRDGQELPLNNVKVKYRPTDASGKGRLVCYDAGGVLLGEGTQENSYWSFSYTSGNYFAWELAAANDPAAHRWLIAAGFTVIGALVALLAVGTVYGICKRRAKKRADAAFCPEESAKEENAPNDGKREEE